MTGTGQEICVDIRAGAATLEQAPDTGIERGLTPGVAAEAPRGAELTRAKVARADGRIGVVPGRGLRADNVAALVAATGASEVHAARLSPSPRGRALSGFDPSGECFATDEGSVRAMGEALA